MALTSHDASLADIIVSASPVSLTATVNNYAVSSFLMNSGSGVFAGSGSTYELNFGTLQYGSGTAVADLGVINAAIWVEYIPQLDEITTDRMHIENGHAVPSPNPGIGIDWDWQAIARMAGTTLDFVL
jgi:hypothetical protein